MDKNGRLSYSTSGIKKNANSENKDLVKPISKSSSGFKLSCDFSNSSYAPWNSNSPKHLGVRKKAPDIAINSL